MSLCGQYTEGHPVTRNIFQHLRAISYEGALYWEHALRYDTGLPTNLRNALRRGLNDPAGWGPSSMPRPGGEADKLGNRYEGLWTVDAALDLLDGSYTDLTVEAVGDEAAGVEFVKTSASGIREYHSIKRQHARGNWTLSLLSRMGPTGKSILGDLIEKVRLGHTAVFSSGTSAADLQELIERACASESLEEFQRRIAGSGRVSGQFQKHVVPLCDDEHSAWIALRCLSVRTTNESRLVTEVERRADSMLRTASGAPIDPQAVRLLIGDLLTYPMGKRYTATSLLDALGDHGLVRSRLAGEATVAEQIRRLNRAHLKEVHARLINRAEISREESRSAVATLLDGRKSVMLEGIAGGGKSCVLAQVLECLEERGVACLVMRLDRLDSGDQRAQAIGTRLGLPKSPAITLGEFASGEPSVLIVDQLDAIGVVSARNQAVWGAFNELLDEARSYPNMRILFACRSFDLERDPRLRALVEDQNQAERIPLQPLDEEVIRSAITAAALDPSSLTQRQVEILSTPLHLHLLIESAKSGALEFTSAQDLFDAFWNHKAAVVSQQMRADSSVWAAAVGRLCNELSERETLAAPALVLDEYAGALDVLASEGVTSVDDGRVRFFHESFFDYAFARAFVRSNRDLAQWLLDDDQHLFRRSQVRQVLQFLRGHEPNRARYLRTLAGLLGHEEIRFHIKKLVLDWLGALPHPTQDEWTIVERLADELGEHAWAVVRNSVPWFDVLQAMGRWRAWLEADDERTDRAVWLLSMPDLLSLRSTAIAALVRGFRGFSGDWDVRLRRLVRVGHGSTSADMRDLVVELIADGTLDEAHPGIAVNGDWWFMWYGLGTEQPSFAVRVLGAWFDRQIVRAAALGKDDPFEFGLGLVTHSEYSGDIIRECAEATPLEFVSELFPRLARFDLSVPKEWIAAPSRWGDPDEQLRDALADAMRTVARDAPTALDSLIEGEPHGESKWMTALLLQAWSANSRAYAERIVGFLLDSDKRLDIGYSSAPGGTDMLAAISRQAVAAASPRCSDESFADLESAILAFTPEWERQHRLMGRTALALLRALDERRLSKSARRRIQELERRFPEAPERGPPHPPSPDDYAPEWVGSPISSADQLRMTDAQWLAAMSRYRTEREDQARASEVVSGAYALSRALEQRVGEDPDRFARLAELMDGSQNPVYFAAILRGLTGSRGAARPGTYEQMCSVLRRIADIGVRGVERTVADAIASLADEDIPADIIRLLCDVAENAADPQQDDWLNRGEGDPEMAPINQAINSDRGRAAQSMAVLLFADRDRWFMLKLAVEKLIADPVLAVRSVAVECLLAVLDTHRDEALTGFGQLIDGGEPILGSNLIERFLHFAMYRDYAAVRPMLLAMVDSRNPAAARAGARQITLASLVLDEAREDGDIVLGGSEEAKVGAAIIYADNVADPTIGAECERRLRPLFADESEVVRRAAARCWNALESDELAKRGSLLTAYVQSIGPDANVTVLTHKLRRAHEPLPPVVCELAERAVSAYGPKAGDIRLREGAAGHDLGPLIMQLHDETEDPDLRRRVLDVIDDMLRSGFMGMSDRLGERYDR